MGELGRPTEMFEILNWVGLLLKEKITKIVIYDQARVNGGIVTMTRSTLDYAGI